MNYLFNALTVFGGLLLATLIGIMIAMMMTIEAEAADYYTLETHGDWEVNLRETSAGNLYCFIGTRNADGELFTIFSATHDRYDMMATIRFDTVFEAEQIAAGFRLREFNQQQWIIDGEAFSGKLSLVKAIPGEPAVNVLIENVGPEFFRALGRGLVLVNGTGSAFSLRGSSDALYGLDHCLDRINTY